MRLDSRDVQLTFLGVAPAYGSLREAPRFTHLLRAVDLLVRFQ